MQPVQPAPSRLAAREGNRGTTLSPARPARTPNAGSSAKPLPDLPPPYDPGHAPLRGRPHPARRKRSAEPLDAKRSRYGRVGGQRRPAGYSTLRIVMAHGGVGTQLAGPA